MGGYMFSKNILSLRINMLRQSYTLLRLRTTYLNATRYLCASINTNENEIKSSSKVVKKDISKAMKAYIERARTHNEFMKQQNYEFQIGKRHLANMMGEDPETFTQKDINAAIQYLFPSGLYEKEARPFMRPPERVFPQRKAAEFDETGRPHHFLFYTGRPAFYKLLFDVVENMNQMYKFEEVMIRKNNVPDPNLAIETAGYKWIGKAALERRLVETLTDREYENFEGAMERLISLPYAYKCLDFINKYRRPLINRFRSLEIPELKYDEEGRGYVTVYECLRKRARGDVTIKTPGSGIITVNGLDISYFHDIQSREQRHGIKSCDSFDSEGDLSLSIIMEMCILLKQSGRNDIDFEQFGNVDENFAYEDENLHINIDNIVTLEPVESDPAEEMVYIQEKGLLSSVF